ncbi:hypothetical protein BVRB_8g190330 [Beta vulgaris subsp. vulgaris]|uniref:Uncharacterized protein n=1 Tax=Beta vulgaris subsp. vulgaris TaxID=3555 RepID=A0A0J8BUG0_BETVV|nr:hypothetical protein BVRB_8g190330 [Beta vulgaris subsp. vulgaris]
MITTLMMKKIMIEGRGNKLLILCISCRSSSCSSAAAVLPALVQQRLFLGDCSPSTRIAFLSLLWVAKEPVLDEWTRRAQLCAMLYEAVGFN